MFNKQPKNITNHYHNVFRSTTEIDYDKLAKAIVKAQQEVEEQKQKGAQQVEKTKGSKTVVSLLAFLSSVAFALLAGACFALFIGGIMAFSSVVELETMQMLTIQIKICFYIVYWLVFLASLFFGIVFFACAKEILKEKDRDFIMSAFSNIIGFIALIVALIALVKGVG